MTITSYPVLEDTLLLRIGALSKEGSLIGVLCFFVESTAVWTMHFWSKQRPDAETEKHPQYWMFLLTLSFLAGIGLTLNLNVFTGLKIETHRFLIQDFLQPILVILFVGTLGWFTKSLSSKREYSFFFWALASCLFLIGGYRQFEVGRLTASDHRKTTSRMKLLLWARAHITSQAVIGATDPELMALIPSISGNWTFVPLGSRSLVPDSESLRRYCLVSYLSHRNLIDLETQLLHPDATQLLRLRAPYTLFVSAYLEPELARQMKMYFSSMNPIKELLNRRMDYIVVRKGTSLQRLKDTYIDVKPTYSNDDWQLVALDRIRLEGPPVRTIATPPVEHPQPITTTLPAVTVKKKSKKKK